MTRSQRRPKVVLPTSIGPPLRRTGGLWTLDLGDLPLFHGLSVLARGLGELLLEHARTDPADVDLERRIRPSENPELHERGIEAVRVLAARAVLEEAPRRVEEFQERLRAVFGALQMEPWRRALLPPGRARSKALVFRFPLGRPERRCEMRCVLERLPSSRLAGKFHLRLTLEDPRGRRLELRSIPHAPVGDLRGRRFLAGSTRISQTLRDLIQRAAERGRRSHLEPWRENSFLFQRLGKAGLHALRSLSVTWSDAMAGPLIEMEPGRLDGALKKAFLALEDPAVRGLLESGETVRVREADLEFFLDVSQQGRALHLSLDRPRHRPSVEDYLRRMPRLAALARREARARPLAGVRVLLIHHITSEVLATIAALRRLGCADLTVLFVRYAGEIPPDYVEALMDLDPWTFRAFALQNVKDPEDPEGSFLLSHLFSPLGDLERLDARFRETRPSFFEAMVDLSGALFGRVLLESGRRGCLLVEDGGYLAPVLAGDTAAGVTLGRFLDRFGVRDGSRKDRSRPLERILSERLLGTVEHTRNGHDRLEEYQAAFGRLARPAFSIAVSRVKVEEESKEVAASILNAVENVLHATGLVLDARRVLVLGSRGAIGSSLLLRLGRLHPGPDRDPILGLDPKVGRRVRSEGNLLEGAAWKDLPPEDRRAVDLVLGVTGRSVLGPREMEEILLEGTAEAVHFASGSTKTVEFHDAARWAARLAVAGRLRGRRVGAQVEDVVDPQTGRPYATRYTFRLPTGPVREKRFLFLSNLTPVNFLFYGVPTEGMDAVLEHLVSASAGLARAVRSGARLDRRLYAVDRDIDARGRPLHGAPPS